MGKITDNSETTEYEEFPRKKSGSNKIEPVDYHVELEGDSNEVNYF